MSTTNTCCTCFKPKATLTCGACNEALCKYCAQFLQPEDFAFTLQRAPLLHKDTFCSPCFTELVEPALNKYNETMARAKEIMVFSKIQNKETRFVGRDEDRIHIPECEDRDEVIMRLAYQAADRDFNGVIDIKLATRKVRNGSYQTTVWFGSGVPAQVNPDKLLKDRSFTNQPN